MRITWEVEQGSASQAMRTFMDAGGVQRLKEYFRRIGDTLGEESRRASFAVYAMGLLGDGGAQEHRAHRGRACPDRVQVFGRQQRHAATISGRAAAQSQPRLHARHHRCFRIALKTPPVR